MSSDIPECAYCGSEHVPGRVHTLRVIRSHEDYGPEEMAICEVCYNAHHPVTCLTYPMRRRDVQPGELLFALMRVGNQILRAIREGKTE